jgi:outer membrane lipoprotein SlyB
MKHYILILTSLFAILLAGCSNQELYFSGQEWGKSQCIENSVSKSQYDECVNSKELSFEEYDRERQAAKGAN